MRQFIAEHELDSSGTLILSPREERYLIRVLRLKEGDSIDVRLKDGSVLTMSLYCIRNTWILVPNSSSVSSVETGVKTADIACSKIEITLLQFLPKVQKMDQIVRQAAECGVKEIFPVRGDYSNIHDCPERKDRWERIVKEARQQSGSPVSTIVYRTSDLESALHQIKTSNEIKTYKIVLTEVSSQSYPVYSILGSITEPVKVVIAVGCEGGFSGDELDRLEKDGFVRLHLKTNILRVETAALYGIAVIQNAVMENKTWRVLG